MASGGERAKLVEEALQGSFGLLDPVIQLVRDLQRCSGPGVRATWSPPAARNRGGEYEVARGREGRRRTGERPGGVVV